MSSRKFNTGDLVKIEIDHELQFIFSEYFTEDITELDEIIGVFLNAEDFFLEGEENPHRMCRILLCNGTIEWFYIEAVHHYKKKEE